MSLIDAERDDDAVLAAEDAAILAEQNPTPERTLPTGGTLAQLIESLSDGNPDPTHGD